MINNITENYIAPVEVITRRMWQLHRPGH